MRPISTYSSQTIMTLYPLPPHRSYLINATSKEDRDMWIEAIRQATPHSPRPVKKELPKDTPTKQELVDRPQYTQRQETVDVAAKLASEAASQPDVEDVSDTSILSHILGDCLPWFAMVCNGFHSHYGLIVNEALQEQHRHHLLSWTHWLLA